jgi:hypothetical protein
MFSRNTMPLLSKTWKLYVIWKARVVDCSYMLTSTWWLATWKRLRNYFALIMTGAHPQFVLAALWHRTPSMTTARIFSLFCFPLFRHWAVWFTAFGLALFLFWNVAACFIWFYDFEKIAQLLRCDVPNWRCFQAIN